MGVYYKVVCDELRESIDPGDVDNGGIKRGSLVHKDHNIGRLVMSAMLGRWHGAPCRVVADESEDPAYSEYKDVTGEVIADYNSDYPNHGIIRHEGFFEWKERTEAERDDNSSNHKDGK